MSFPLPADGHAERLLETLELLLAIDAATLAEALQQASDLVAEALRAEKVDAFLYEPASDSLVALGTSRTPMGQRQHELGLHRLPLANGGSPVWVFTTHSAYHTNHAHQDPWELRGLWEDLGIRSQISTPLNIGQRNRGVLQACSARPEHFSVEDFQFLQAVGRWLGLVGHRAEMRDLMGQAGPGEVRAAHQQTMIALGDSLVAAQSGANGTADDPDGACKASLLRWKIRHLETAMGRTETILAALEQAFAESQHQMAALTRVLRANQEQITRQEGLLAHHANAALEAAQVRRTLEDKVRHAEATIMRLTMQHDLLNEED